eukprot:9104792-Pyramimonas_sp.AAC.1
MKGAALAEEVANVRERVRGMTEEIKALQQQRDDAQTALAANNGTTGGKEGVNKREGTAKEGTKEAKQKGGRGSGKEVSGKENEEREEPGKGRRSSQVKVDEAKLEQFKDVAAKLQSVFKGHNALQSAAESPWFDVRSSSFYPSVPRPDMPLNPLTALAEFEVDLL